MVKFVAGIVLGLLLSSPATMAFEGRRACVLAVLGEQPAAYIRQYVEGVRKGDYLIARECWRES